MMNPKRSARTGLLPFGAVVTWAGAALLSACGGGSVEPGPGPGVTAGTPGTGGGSSGSGNGGASGGTGTGGATACMGSETIAPKRVVRLSFNQMANTVRSLLGNEFADQVGMAHGIGDATARTFPPLLSPREGLVLIDSKWEVGDKVATDAGKYVFDHFAMVTGCAVPATDACAQQFLTTFAEKAWRRPLSEREKTALLTTYGELKTTLQDPAVTTPPIEEAVQLGVYAIMSAPSFLYRTEFGTGSTTEGSMTQYEVADQLSYFLTDGPPDAPLLASAAAGMLTNEAEVAAHADRLLATPAARLNLEQAIFAYFSLQFLDTVVIDAAKVPGISVDAGLIDSMYTESEAFLSTTLWGGALTDLLTSRKTIINDRLAPLYGIAPFPPAGATLDANGFAPVELPEYRAGLLSQAGFLTARARPSVPSVVARGLAVNAFMLCVTNPPFPEQLADEIDKVSESLEGQTERQKAEYRADPSRTCSGCHTHFDPYGLALENFDIIGRYRTMDEQMRPIDATVTLPPVAGGGMVVNALEMGKKIAENGSFARCMARNFVQFALADGQPVPVDGCAIDTITKKFLGQPDQSFSRLLREIAISKTLAVRSAGGM